MQWRILFFGIANLTLLTSASTAWAQDDDWLDGEDEEEETERSDDDVEDIDLEEDPDESKINGRTVEGAEGDGLYLGEEYEPSSSEEKGKTTLISIVPLRKNWNDLILQKKPSLGKNIWTNIRNLSFDPPLNNAF